jgi:hypothetical protein
MVRLMVQSAYRQADEDSLAAVAAKGQQEISLISSAIVMKESPVRVKGGCRHQVDGTAGLPSAPEMPLCAQPLCLVPFTDIRRRLRSGQVATEGICKRLNGIV